MENSFTGETNTRPGCMLPLLLWLREVVFIIQLFSVMINMQPWQGLTHGTSVGHRLAQMPRGLVVWGLNASFSPSWEKLPCTESRNDIQPSHNPTPLGTYLQQTAKKNNNFKALYLIDKLLLYWKKGNIRDKILNSADYPQILLNEFKKRPRQQQNSSPLILDLYMCCN